MISSHTEAPHKARASLINIVTTGKGFSLATRDEILQLLPHFGYYVLECQLVYLSAAE